MRPTQPPKILVIIFISLIFLTSGLFAQTFELKDYKNPDYQFKMIETGFSFGSNTNAIRKSYSGSQSWPELKTDNFAISGLLTPKYHAYKNRRHYQGSQRFNLNLNPGYLTNNNETINQNSTQSAEYKLLRFMGDLYTENNNRFYNNKLQFFEVNIKFQYRYVGQNNSQDKDPVDYQSAQSTIFREQEIGLHVPLLIGMGRIESVQDARLALYIFEDLKKSGNLKHEPNKEEIETFASFITQLKNKRHFDSRLRKISEITAVDSMLHTMGLKTGSEASYFTLLNDNWDFASGPQRESGSRFSFGVAPRMVIDLNFQRDKYLDATNQESVIENKGQYRAIGADILVSYLRSVPTSAEWQHDTYAAAVFSPLNTYSITKNIDGGTSEVESFYKEPSFGARLSHEIGYYPNSRTSISLLGEAGYQYFYKAKRKVDPLEEEESTNNLSATLRLQGHYYLSPQLTFNALLAGTYNSNEYMIRAIQTSARLTTHNKGFSGEISFGFTYQLF